MTNPTDAELEAAYWEWRSPLRHTPGLDHAFRAGWTAALAHRPAPTESVAGESAASALTVGRDARPGEHGSDKSSPTDLREAVAESIASMVNEWFGDASKAPPFPAELIARRLDRFVLVSAPRAEGVTDLDRAWRAVDALGGPWPSGGDMRDHHMEEGYNRALDEACAAIEKLGGRDNPAMNVSAPRSTEQEAMRGGRWVSADDVDALVRRLDVALNGDGAARQASLCDIVSQVEAKRIAPRAVTDAGLERACQAFDDVFRFERNNGHDAMRAALETLQEPKP